MGRKLLTLGTGPIDSSISVTQLNCDGVSSSVFCCLLWFSSLLAVISVGAGGVVVGCGDSTLLLVLGMRLVVNVMGLRPRESSTSLAQSNCCGSSIASGVVVVLESVVVVEAGDRVGAGICAAVQCRNLV